MAVDPKLVFWLVATFMAVTCLARLMRRRQNSLLHKLSLYVEEQREWSKKKSKAARLAQKLVREKSIHEAQEKAAVNGSDVDRYDKYSSSGAAIAPPREQPVQEAA